MKPRIKVGLIIGLIGLVINVAVSTAVGLCGPGLALVAGALSGFFTARQETSPSKSEGAKAGAISGVVVGALVLVGQVLGGLIALLLIQRSGMQSLFGRAPAPNAGPAEQAIYYLAGIGVGACFGVFGLLLSALAAAGTAYLTTPEYPPQVTPPSQ